MNNKIYNVSRKISPKYNIKTLLMSCFNFQYAGVCNVFITKNRNDFVVHTSGFTIENNIVFFNYEKKCNFKFSKLFYAVCFFNDVVKSLTSSVDWFTPDFIESLVDNQKINEEIVG